MRKRIWMRCIGAILAIGLVISKLGLNNQLTYRQYTIHDQRISTPVRIIFLSDLHSNQYGEQQAQLMEMVDAAQADLIILGGDLLDETMPTGPVEDLLIQLVAKYPVYYATGNHEYYLGRAQAMKDLVANYGIPVLEGKTTYFEKGQTRLAIAGLDDLHSGQYQTQWQTVQDELSTNTTNYRILLNHRPEQFPLLEDGPVDLVLAGHAHGGQWRVPGLLNGLYAPGQGLLPTYVGGLYKSSWGSQMIVSRGLETQIHKVPRIFNPPEIVIIDLEGETDAA